MKRFSLGNALSSTILPVIGWPLDRINALRTAVRIRAPGRCFEAIMAIRALDEEREGLFWTLDEDRSRTRSPPLDELIFPLMVYLSFSDFMILVIDVTVTER
jgi:hypothetical protein